MCEPQIVVLFLLCSLASAFFFFQLLWVEKEIITNLNFVFAKPVMITTYIRFCSMWSSMNSQQNLTPNVPIAFKFCIPTCSSWDDNVRFQFFVQLAASDKTKTASKLCAKIWHAELCKFEANICGAYKATTVAEINQLYASSCSFHIFVIWD